MEILFIYNLFIYKIFYLIKSNFFLIFFLIILLILSIEADTICFELKII